MNLQFSISLLNSTKYLSKSLLFISSIENVENPGVSAIYVFSSISYNLIVVVVFFPLLFFLLISPSKLKLSSKIPFINVDFPTPEFPENAFILFFNSSFSLSIPFLFLASVFKTL